MKISAKTKSESTVKRTAPVTTDPVVEEFEKEEQHVSTTEETDMEEVAAVIGYISAKTDDITIGVIPNKIAAKKYEELCKAEGAKKAADQIKVKPKLDPEGKPYTGNRKDDLAFTDKYTQTNFRSFFWTEYEKMVKEGYMKYNLNETRAELLVVKNLLKEDNNDADDRSVAIQINEKLQTNAAAYDFKKGIFVIRRKKLVGFMSATDIPCLPVLNYAKNTNPSKPDGRILLREKNSSTSKEPTYDLVYVKRYEDGMVDEVKTIAELGIPHACNTQKSENHGKVLTEDNIKKLINKDTVEKFTKINMKEIGVAINTAKLKKTLSKEEYAEKSAKWFIEPSNKTAYGKKFAEIGVTPDMVKAFRKPGKGGDRKSKKSFDELYDDSVNALTSLAKARNNK